MRIIVMFDLPVTTQAARKEATKFRNFLLQDGYVMLQFSVYYRICNGYDNVKKHEDRLQKNLPGKGSVRFFCMTEKQFSNMKLLVGKRSPVERKVNADQLSLF